MHRTTKIIAAALLTLALCGCRHAAPEPVTLSYFRLGWSQPDELREAEPLTQKFIRKTGIQLKNLPVPEDTLDQLELSRKLLRSGSGPDVLGVDLIWSGILSDDLIDLRPYLATEISSIQPELLSSYQVGQRVVAMPYQMQVGMMEYRRDLLREYGYSQPPKTWDELEKMALRIQTGERAKGNKDFWGYVWQGADAESLTCNALEWQVAAGGGQIIESDRTISVNNPAAIRAWERARHWIGWISPPGVIAYQELDSMNVFDSGRAAFTRLWGGATLPVNEKTRLTHNRDSRVDSKTGYASIPGGPGGWGATLGGSGLGVSSRSLHPQEAVELIRFLVQAQMKFAPPDSREWLALDMPFLRGPAGPPGVSPRSGLARRPSIAAGPAYNQVAKAYIAAVHSVLTGQRAAPEAASDLERQLISVTGFPTGPPKKVDE